MPSRRLGALLLVLGLLVAGPALAQPAQTAPAGAETVPLLLPLAHGQTVALPELDPAIPSPAEFLGYPLGSRFTHHSRILDYLEALAASSPRVTSWRYGETYEGRPLTLLAISAPETVARLEEVRREHLRLADPRRLSSAERERLVDELPVVVWLAYGVHGNESSSAEAAMAAAYALAAAGGEWTERLGGTIVLIDPLVNPDGRERYVAFYEQAQGRVADPNPGAAEHLEPWPGGRENHYMIDLNRDWSWATQQETRDRLAAFHAWEPQVYVDYHEMFPESSYFFPPAADPVNPLLDQRTVAWLDTFGRGNAEAFDRLGWTYFKSEVFDLFYPGYGDSYPAFRGAVGMTYEMAGHGRAGTAYRRRDGTVLTLADRIARHFTTSLATVETAARDRHALLETFVAARADAAAAEGPAYLWQADAPEAGALAELLALHGIEVGQLTASARLRVHPVAGVENAVAERSFPAGTYTVHAGQPLGNLAQALLDRAPRLEQDFLERQRERLERNVEPEFYDITSWSLPLAFNVEAWVAPSPGSVLDGRTEAPRAAPGGVTGDGRVGFLVRPAGIAGYRFAAALQSAGITYRMALDELEVDGERYPAGTLFIPRLGNEAPESEPLRTRIDRLATGAGIAVASASTSYTTSGVALGSSQVATVLPARVGVLSGNGISPTSFGFLWHLLDRQVGVPHSRLSIERLGGADLSDLDVLVLPDGWSYSDGLGERAGEALAGWVRQGGLLVAVGNAHSWLREKELTAVEAWSPESAAEGKGGKKEKQSGGDEGDDEEEEESPLADRLIDTPGAIVATRMTPGHPLTVGVPSSPPVLFSGSTVLLPTGDPQVDVLRAEEGSPVLTGVVWPEAEERLAGSLLVSFERQGRGAVVLFAQDPDYRLFWRGTVPLFLNAVMIGPSLLPGRGY